MPSTYLSVCCEQLFVPLIRVLYFPPRVPRSCCANEFDMYCVKCCDFAVSSDDPLGKFSDSDGTSSSYVSLV